MDYFLVSLIIFSVAVVLSFYFMSDKNLYIAGIGVVFVIFIWILVYYPYSSESKIAKTRETSKSLYDPTFKTARQRRAQREAEQELMRTNFPFGRIR